VSIIVFEDPRSVPFRVEISRYFSSDYSLNVLLSGLQVGKTKYRYGVGGGGFGGPHYALALTFFLYMPPLSASTLLLST